MNTNTALCFTQLNENTLISIDGPDACKFLQGQVTCDINQLNNTASLGAHCNHKGRMLFSFVATQPAAEKILLRLPEEQLQTALGSLNKYIIFSKASAEAESHKTQHLGIWGTQAEDIIRQVFGATPGGDKLCLHSDNYTVIQISPTRFECWLTPEQTANITALLEKNGTASSSQDWQLLDIQSGIGHVSSSTREQLIPQMLNYQFLGGISFTKGCYTGQEVVARMQYHGKLKRHMYRVEIPENTEIPAPGSSLYSLESDQSIGTVISAASSDSHREALIVATDDSVNTNSVYLKPNGKEKLTLLELPYAINEDE